LQIQKPSVARVIVRAIRNGEPPGRFLKKDEKSGKWLDVGDKKAAEKTSQALREKTGDEQESGKSTTLTLADGGHVQNSSDLIEFDADKLMATISATVAAVPTEKHSSWKMEQGTNNPPIIPDPISLVDDTNHGKQVSTSAITPPELQDVTAQSASVNVAGEYGKSNGDEFRNHDTLLSSTLDDSVGVITKSESV
jgi:hypothetical protein